MLRRRLQWRLAGEAGWWVLTTYLFALLAVTDPGGWRVLYVLTGVVNTAVSVHRGYCLWVQLEGPPAEPVHP